MWSFSKNQEVADISTVPEHFRGLYDEDVEAGVFKLSQDEKVGTAVQALTSLSVALEKSRREHDNVKKKVVDLSSLEDFGMTPDEILETFTTRLSESAKAGDSDVTKKIEKIRADMTAGFVKESEGKEARIEGLKGQLYTHLVESKVMSALATAKGDTDLAPPFVQKNVRVEEEDGKLTVLVVDDDGQPRFSATGNPMSIAERVEEMKAEPKYKPLFHSDVGSGGGGTPPGGSPNRSTIPKADMTSHDKLKAGLDKQQFKKASGTG